MRHRQTRYQAKEETTMRTTRFIRHRKRAKAAGPAHGHPQTRRSDGHFTKGREALLRELLEEAQARTRLLQSALDRFLAHL
jgi:hypothetical protein